MIPSIIKREFASINSSINIVWTRCDDNRFYRFIEKVCSPCNIIDFDNTYFGLYDPSIVICNNRLTNLDKCITMCKFYHCPLIIIDHETKPAVVSNKVDKLFDIHPVIQIALSNDIHLSWNRVHDYILEYERNTEKTWKNLIYNLYKQKFLITDYNKNETNENQK